MNGPISRAWIVLRRQKALSVRPLIWRAVITTTLLGLIVWFLPLYKLWAAIGRIGPQIWIVVIAGFLAGHFVAAWKWRLLIAACGLRLKFNEAVKAHAAGLFANLCLPSLVGGDVVRGGVVVRRHGCFEVIALGSLVDRIIDICALSFLAGIGGLLNAGALDSVVVQVFVIVALVLPSFVVVAGAIVLLVPTDRFPVMFAPRLSRAGTAIRSLCAQPNVAVVAFLMSVAIQSAFVIFNVFIAQAMGLKIDISVWFLAWPLAKIIALVPVSLGGIGVREVALAGLLVPFGIEPVDAVAQSLVWEMVLIVSGLLAGVFSVLMSRVSYRKKALT